MSFVFLPVLEDSSMKKKSKGWKMIQKVSERASNRFPNYGFKLEFWLNSGKLQMTP